MQKNTHESGREQAVQFGEQDRVVIQRVMNIASKVGQNLFRNIDPMFLGGRPNSVGMTGYVSDVMEPTMGPHDVLIREQSVYLVAYDQTVVADDGSRHFGSYYLAEELGAAGAPTPVKPE